MVFSIAAFHFFEVPAVGYFCTTVLKRESESKARRYNHSIIFSGITYLPVLIYYPIATIRHVVIAIIILKWLEPRLCH